MGNIDRHGKLNEEPITFWAAKDGKVLIYWHGKQITILKDQAADKFWQAIRRNC